MCGISGIYKLNGRRLELESLKRFTDALSHRGPDGMGYELFDDQTLGLGQRRLAILDLSESARQPMSYSNERYWITYNGEVFNFLEIRVELESLGHNFISTSDTEVILAAFSEWGLNCLHKFNGMWAFAIWDSRMNMLTLSRDRFGIKPLYYLFVPGIILAFTSETRAFKHLDGFNRNFDSKLLDLNIADTYALEGRGYTPFEGILQLLPGHYIEFRSNDYKVQQKRWWDIRDYLDMEIPKSLQQQADKFYDLFREACRKRLISDVPIGTALSGGLDSTSVYTTVFDIAQNENLGRINHDSQRAFTAVFPKLPQDEREFAKMAVDYKNGAITYIETDYLNLPERISRETELSDLISTNPITSMSSVYRGMRNEGIVVSLDGHGVDEMLYGYRDMVYTLFNDSIWNGSINDFKKYSEVLLNLYHFDNKDIMLERIKNSLYEKQKREATLLYKLKKSIKKKSFPSQDNMPFLPELSDKPYDFKNLVLKERIVFNEFFLHTLPALLRNFDRAGMMNGVEIRMPFMDWRLVTYVFSLPITSKIGNGYTKLILREAMKNRIDERLRTRTYKVGISSPIEFWVNGVLKEWVLDTLKDKKLNSELERAYKLGKVDTQLSEQVWISINISLINSL